MRALRQDELVEVVARSLEVATTDATDLVKPALRRALFLLAPCSRADLTRFVAEPLAPLSIARETVEIALEELIVYGDALEMRKLASDPWDSPSSVLRPAPPSFVQREDGTIIVLGVAGDHPSALTPDLQARVVQSGPVRVLRVSGDGELSAHLRLLGLTPLSDQAWLRTPKIETAASHHQEWVRKLESVRESASGIDALEILDPDRTPRFYAGRWREPSGTTSGVVLARRPQLYGARLWSIAQFSHGICRRLLDVYEDDERQRPCDIAWRFQAAVDALNGRPQEVRVRHVGPFSSLDFFSPLPAFAERRLALVGVKKPGERCLFSFEMDAVGVEAELAALQTNLWMRPARDEEQR